MAQYILLIHSNTETKVSSEEWQTFFEAANRSGMFKGGSEIGERTVIGDSERAKTTDHIVGFMRFDCDDKQRLLDLLQLHPIVRNRGVVELCEMPRS